MLRGPSSQTGELLSPAKVRVARFLKGHGPSTVHVETAIQRSGSGYVENADGIDPRAGQRWKIYSESKRQPYATSVCDGSRRIAERRHSPSERTFRKDGVRLRYPATWRAYSYSNDYSSFSTTIVYLSNVRVHDPCVTHTTPQATTTRCGQPVNHLAPGSVLVSWSANGFPGWSFAKARGTPISVDGHRAKLLRKKSTCRIRADEEIDVTVQRRPADNWYFVRACIRGPGTARFAEQFKRLLDTAHISP
jgi:hypothetical protein